MRQTGISTTRALFAALTLSALLNAGLASAAVGDQATLSGPLMDGKKFSLEAERGKVVLVVLWATWCPTCRRELPKLEQFYQEHAKQGFDIVAVSIDDTAKEVTEFLAKNKYSFPVGWRNRFKDNLGPVRGTPTIYLLDRQGKILARTEGGLTDADWWAIEDALMKKPQPHARYELEFVPGSNHRVL
jgi:cytochrome c biogenesis protein CcmG, thiol:disulfide interchange protein DsbE